MAHITRTPPTRNFPKGGYQATYLGPDKRERTKTFARKKEAEDFIAAQSTNLSRGEWVDPGRRRITVGEWADVWQKSIVHLEPSTVAWYEAKLRNHVLPEFERVEVGLVDQLVVRRWVSDMTAAGTGAKTIRGAVVTLSQVLGVAIEGGALRANPTKGVKLPRAPKREMAFLTAAEVERLAGAATEPYGTLIRFAAYSGLRAGEIGGLRVGRLDLLRRRVEVREALKEVGGNVTFGSTKTHEARTICIPRQLCDELAAYLAARVQKLGRAMEPGDLVFTAPAGGPLRHNLFYRRTYKPAVERAGLPSDLRFHDLRHTCAALLIGEGHQQYEIMRHLGHSSIQVTIDTYGHLFEDRKDAVADTLEKVWAAT